MILTHQEYWDGRGYPLGIAGDNIPLGCRIMSIVAAYDAMTNDRPYRRAMASGDALAGFRRCAGTQFDPELVALFISPVERASQGVRGDIILRNVVMAERPVGFNRPLACFGRRRNADCES